MDFIIDNNLMSELNDIAREKDFVDIEVMIASYLSSLLSHHRVTEELKTLTDRVKTEIPLEVFKRKLGA